MRSMSVPISESLLDEETDLAKMEVLKMMNVNKGAQSWGDGRCSTGNHGLGLCQSRFQFDAYGDKAGPLACVRRAQSFESNMAASSDLGQHVTYDLHRESLRALQ